MEYINRFLIIFVILISTFLFARYYKKRSNSIDSQKVATGFGVTLPIFLILSYCTLETNYISSIIFKSLLFIFFVGLIYYIDDIKGLSPFIRLLISSFTGLFLINLRLTNTSHDLQTLSIYILSIGTLCLLTNVFNFYDGADLNLITTIFLFGVSLINNQQWVIFSLVLIGFSIGFGIVNSESKSLYLGDSGSFTFASIVFLIFIFSFLDITTYPINSIYVITLPIFDVLYVLLIRLNRRHNLLTRNYLHIYQRLSIEHKRFYYLLPQVIHFLLALFLNKTLNMINIFSNYQNIILVCMVFTPIFYLLTRGLFVKGNYFFGDG